ncbi:MAG: membrane protein insertion efficiency factor YidD [Gemmatimonadota bacterium]
MIRFYRTAISPLTPSSCRYIPTCSRFAMEAIELHGLGRGGWLAFRRFLRCHPWGGHGVDLVPPAHSQPALPSEGDVPPDEVAGERSSRDPFSESGTP